MSFLFPQKRPKTINEVVYALNEWILRVGDTASVARGSNGARPPPAAPGRPAAEERPLTDAQRQAAEEAGRLLAQFRRTMSVYDEEGGAEPDLLAALAKEVYATDVLLPLVLNLRALDFDARRDVSTLFALVMQRPPTVDYLLFRIPELFTILIRQAGEPEIHRPIGHMLRECARHEALAAHIMNSQSFWWFFQYMDHPEFEVATDNFQTFQEFLRAFPDLATQFLLRNADYFSQCINGLIRSNNYVTKRQTLRMLFQIMRQQRNQPFLIVYVNNLENLKLMMRLLKDKSKNINTEAFQIFKIIVANPKKPAPILEVLIRNKSKLLDMLDKSHILADRAEDKAYQREREYVRDKIRALPDPAPRGPSPGQGGAGVSAVSAGMPAGVPVGTPAGVPAGTPAGFPNGNPAGASGGNPAGFPNGKFAGVSNGNVSGVSNGNPAGVSNGNPAGVSNGNPAGVSNGNPTGVSNGNPAGVSNGNPAGISNARVPNGNVAAVPNGNPDGVSGGNATHGAPHGAPAGIPTGNPGVPAGNPAALFPGSHLGNPGGIPGPAGPSSSHLAPRLVPQPATHLQPQLTAPQLIHRPASPSRAPAHPDILNAEMARRR